MIDGAVCLNEAKAHRYGQDRPGSRRLVLTGPPEEMETDNDGAAAAVSLFDIPQSCSITIFHDECRSIASSSRPAEGRSRGLP